MAEPANDLPAYDAGDDGRPAAAEAYADDEPAAWEEEDFAIGPAGFSEHLPAIALSLLAVAWLGLVGWALWPVLSARPLTIEEGANAIAVASAPLALLGVLWLALRRTSRREALLFGRTSEAMRAEAARLDAHMRAASARIAEMREAVSAESDRLMALGDEAAGRLGHIGEELRGASATIEEKSVLLDRAARAAREDVKVLMNDLPRAQEQARGVSAELREAGVEAHEQAVSLDAQLAALANRGREADEIASGAAQRLAANLARIEGVAEVAAGRLDETGTHINAAVDAALERSSGAVEDARRAVDEIGVALARMVGDAHTALDRQGEEASGALETRIGEVNSALDAIGERVKGVETWLAGLGEAGEVHFGAVHEQVAAMRGELGELGKEFAQQDSAADRLIARAGEIRAAVDASTTALGEALPSAFKDADSRAEQLRENLAALLPEVEHAEKLAAQAADYVAVSGESLTDQRAAIEAFVDGVGSRIATIREAVAEFEAMLGSANEQAKSISEAAAPQLIETLMRVREVADQAAEKARAAFGEVIPKSAAALGEATQLAMAEAFGSNIEGRIEEIAQASQRAAEAANEAAERLDRRIAEITAASSAMEERLAESEQDGFARSVALLIESLNSTAIDVTKILSNDVTDTAWAAYLKGDRGVFSRRAVRLLETGEAREIAQHYDADPEFQEQVNRYIHDFEAMLRRVLAARDGSPLAITLLSSDNGKLYVALAQSIERLRA